MKVSIVIPAYNHYDLLHQLLYDLYRNCNSVNEVVVVNDASTDEELFSGLNWWKGTGMLPIREIRAKENKGFLISANLGLKQATGDIKILISTDVRVYGDIVQAITLILKANPKSLVGGVVYTHDTGWNKFGKKIFPYVEGWMLATTNYGWEELGYLDRRYVPNDFEDVDLSTTALSLGYELIIVEPGSAVHTGGKSIGYSPEREALTRINQKKFEEKWIK
jgi:GT2 family glycosyltransferase